MSGRGSAPVDPRRAEAEGRGQSPWSALAGVPHLDVAPHRAPITATLALPGSKSYSNRALILAAMADGRSTLGGLLRSDDSYWCIEALGRLGAAVTVERDTAIVMGLGRRRPLADARLYIGSAGTSARFLPGLLAAGDGGRVTLDASRQMRARPMAPLLEALRSMGAAITCPLTADAPPLDIAGGTLRGGAVTMSGAVSSQFISGVLMAGPLAPEGVHVTIPDHVVQKDYVAMTLDMMATFGASVAVNTDLTDMRVDPGAYRPTDVMLEADASTATYFFALAAVTGGHVTVTNVGTATRQPDLRLIDILERMGCAVTRAPGQVSVAGPEGGRLAGGFDVDMRPLSDATLTLAAIAPFADGPIAIHNVAHIRNHESDRIAVICRALADLGIRVEERPDGLTVHPGRPTAGVMDTHDDHRVAMALAVLGVAGEGLRLRDPGCVSKTCPPFFDLLAGLGVGVTTA
ncbi:3-phosphoshikimate 1-carboxyvinyltransferase [Roseospira visakhapatnamensis]|uniref:3-phosphoshikimate 1-carboxyvinyltransferase n=1 Tax=Roseospira visakhapatnamensis TaxID=390880 RepID=A0A7W6RB17_9PROT|nr:3-phosphoshikimate 1-carboxyvinyltransferase [Roseospira visakhapatnamensis]MBB4265062.1 3-phosphoshikimate 1-carboxyvinyltransferase [Roseospira visakhapatnamensis]